VWEKEVITWCSYFHIIVSLKTATQWTFCPAYFHQHCGMSISLLVLKIGKMFTVFCVWFVMTFPLNIVGRNMRILSWETCLGLHVVFLCTVKRVFCQLLTAHNVFEIACNNFNQTWEFHVSVCVCARAKQAGRLRLMLRSRMHESYAVPYTFMHVT
jgi:hypothetical protein